MYGFPVHASVSGALEDLRRPDGGIALRRETRRFNVHGLTGTFKVQGRLRDATSWRLAGYESSI